MWDWNCYHFDRSSRREVALRLAAVLSCAAWISASGCSQQPDSAIKAKLTPATLEERAKRRAYDGAPPTIPHEPFGQECATCHAIRGKEIPTIGFAPANPHLGDNREGALSNCTQCHLFKRSEALFVESEFQGSHSSGTHVARAHSLAPPVVPHSINMRSNCLACHSGIAARPEIVCSHPERTNCSQCHVAVESYGLSPERLTTIP